MQLSLRWFGPDDAVTLGHIRQIPGVGGVVSALHHLPAGQPWPAEAVVELRQRVEAEGLRLTAIESIPVHEDIKQGKPQRERRIDVFAESVRAVGEAGIDVVCYNFMPVFDWTRTQLAFPLGDESTALAYDQDVLDRIDPRRGIGDLPGWAAARDADELAALLEGYRTIDAERLWDHLAYFLERVVPAAEAAGVRLAIHPDDPPWPVFGLPRIITDGPALDRLMSLVDSPANGVTFCTGSFGADPGNDLPAMARRVAAAGRLHFLHARNVRITGPKRFHEAPHPTTYGNVDMLAVLRAIHDHGFDGPARPDHGRSIWGEGGRPAYGLYDRALGAAYLNGLWEAITN
jgi:mannonate dehydratase